MPGRPALVLVTLTIYFAIFDLTLLLQNELKFPPFLTKHNIKFLQNFFWSNEDVGWRVAQQNVQFPPVFNRPDLDNRANHPQAIKNQLRSDKVTQSHKLRPD